MTFSDLKNVWNHEVTIQTDKMSTSLELHTPGEILRKTRDYFLIKHNALNVRRLTTGQVTSAFVKESNRLQGEDEIHLTVS